MKIDAKCSSCGALNSCMVCCTGPYFTSDNDNGREAPCDTCGQIGTHHRDCAKMKCCKF
jgi:hypothetical protein